MVEVTATVVGDLRVVLREIQDDVAGALREGVGHSTRSTQADLRAQTRAAGLGHGLEKAWQTEFYPRNPTVKTLRPAGLVFSKAVVLHDAFIAGATITARRGRYLVIPTREAEAMGFATTTEGRGGKHIAFNRLRRAARYRAAIDALGAENIRDIPLPNGRRLIVYRVPSGRGKGMLYRGPDRTRITFRRGSDVPLFIMVPQVRLAPRLDFEAALSRAETTLVRALDASLQRAPG